MNCTILGCGGYLPEHILKNTDLERLVDTSDEWIVSRTGITQRHIASENQYSSHLAFEAAKDALRDADISASDIDLVIVATTTPDNSFPSVATKLQSYLGLEGIPAFDLQGVCSGFIYGLQVVSALMKTGKYQTVLLVCSEKMSALVDWNDRATCVLFGDGAGALVLQVGGSGEIVDSELGADGRYYDLLYTDGGVSMNMMSGKIRMNGPELFRQAIEKMAWSVEKILQKNNLTMDDIKYFIPHQANSRIIDNVVERLKFNPDKVVKTISTHANCSAASIPLALAHLKSSKTLKKGDLIVVTAFGAGITWGSALIRW